MSGAVHDVDAGRREASAGLRLTIRYFAWVRERIGRGEEVLEVPASVETVGELQAWLATLGAEYAAIFKDTRSVRAAVDQTHVKPSHRLVGAREVAFFPPVTGG